MNSSTTKVISIGTRLLSIVITGFLWHATYKYIYKKMRYDQEDEYRNSNNADDYSDCYKVIRMKIPSYAKGGIIGKNGSTIKRIQDKTKTTIKFLNKNSPAADNIEDKQSDWNIDSKDGENQESSDMILIRGLTLRVMEAEKEIKNIIASIPIFSEETMVVDNRFVGKIIGKKGENIKRLKECYKVHIDVDRNESPQRTISIRGTVENITECRKDIVKMIDLLMKEGKSLYPCNPLVAPVVGLVVAPVLVPITKATIAKESLLQSEYAQYPGALNEAVPICVSSVVDCGKFHAHLVGEQQEALCTLIDAMTEYFSDNRTDGSVQRVFSVGDIVAGYYEASLTWQRVKVIDTSSDNSGLMEVLYLDYGDTSLLAVDHLRSFDDCPQFLQLPFQALRLLTHGVRPVGPQWSEGDIALFEDLTKVGQSHPLTAVLKARNGLNVEVQLLDTASGVDIGQRLIADGVALAKE